MASSFAEKILKATALKEKGPESSSRTRKYSASGSTSKMGSSSSSKYGSKSPLPDSVIPLPTTRLPASVPSTRRRSSNDFTSSTGTLSSRSSRFTEGPTNANKRGRIRRSVGELESMLSRPCAIREGTRSQESPYGKKLPYERSPKRKSSFADSLKDLSNAFSSPVASPSPQVSTLGSSPRLDYGDIPGISASPLVDDDQIFQSEHQDPGGSRDKGTSQSGNGQELEPQQLGEVGTSNAATSDPPTSTLQPPRVNVGRAFTSLLPETPPLMTNPLYPTISSPEYSPSPPPPSAAHIDGFDIPAFGINLPNAPGDVSPMSKEEEIFPVEPVAAFLQKRKAAAATQRQKGPGTGDPNSAASQAILKRRTQVLSTVQKAKARLSVLTYEGTKKRRSFKNNCFGRFRRWLYERERKRMVGKGTVVNKLWLDSLKMMEVRYGSPMMVAFGFIRWVFLLNAFLAVLWLCFIVIPFLAHPPKTFSWKVFWGTLRDKKLVKETFQGSNLEKTFVYYGGYTYTRSEQRGWYRVDYFYAVMIAATFLFSFICVLVRIAGTIMRSGDVGVAVRLYPFSTLVFSSWDFHLINTDAASKLRRGIRMRLKEMVADARDLEKTVGLRDRLMSAKRATALFILWPMLMAANVAIVVELVMKAEQVNHAFGSNYAQAVLLSALNIVTPMIIRVLVDLEDFRPATAERVVLMKLFCVRVLNLASLYYRLFMMLEHTLQLRENKVVVEACLEGNRCFEGFTCCTATNMTQWHICTDRDIQFCLPACTENAVGIQLLRLIVMTTLMNNAYELIYGFGYVWASSGNKRQLYIEDMAIDVVYVQSLVWVGSCFSPMATVLGFFANLLTWYGMRLALFRTCAPVEKAHSASRTASLTYGLLLLILILSTIPATLNVMQRSSGFCGPIQDRVSQYTVLTGYIQKAPSGLWLTVQWLTNPAVLLGVILLLVFGVVLLQSKLVQSRQFLQLTKHEMGMQRRDASERLTRVRQGSQSGTGPGAKGSLPQSFPGRSSTPAVAAPFGQVEAVNHPTETNFRREPDFRSMTMTALDTEKFLFSLANEGKEPPAGGQGRSSSVLQTTRRRSNQVKHRLRRPSFSHEEKSRRAPGASRQRASAICTLLDMVCVMSGAPRSRSEGTSGISLSADNSSKSASEDKARVPVALIRGLKLPSDAKVAPSAPSIWSILTPLSGSFLWGSLSSEEASTSRSLVSLPRPGGGSDAMSTARTSLSSPPESPVRASLSAAASAVNKLLRAASEGPECRPSPPPTSPLELLHAATPLSTHHRTVSCSPVQCGVMPIASTPTVSRSSVSVPGGTRADQSSERSSSVSGSSTQERYRRSTGGGVSVSWWGRIIGRPKRESASKRLSRMTARSGARISSQRSGFPSPVMSAIGVQQWLARAVEGSRSGSENLTTPREASV